MILVGTHQDETGGDGSNVLPLLETRVKTHKINFGGSMAVSCTKKTGIQQLYRKIVEHAEKNLPQVPKSYLDVDKVVENIKHDELIRGPTSDPILDDWSVFTSKCHEASLHYDAAALREAMEFLHNVGSVLYFKHHLDMLVLGTAVLANHLLLDPRIRVQNRNGWWICLSKSWIGWMIVWPYALILLVWCCCEANSLRCAGRKAQPQTLLQHIERKLRLQPADKERVVRAAPQIRDRGTSGGWAILSYPLPVLRYAGC